MIHPHEVDPGVGDWAIDEHRRSHLQTGGVVDGKAVRAGRNIVVDDCCPAANRGPAPRALNRNQCSRIAADDQDGAVRVGSTAAQHDTRSPYRKTSEQAECPRGQLHRAANSVRVRVEPRNLVDCRLDGRSVIVSTRRLDVLLHRRKGDGDTTSRVPSKGEVEEPVPSWKGAVRQVSRVIVIGPAARPRSVRIPRDWAAKGWRWVSGYARTGSDNQSEKQIVDEGCHGTPLRPKPRTVQRLMQNHRNLGFQV